MKNTQLSVADGIATLTLSRPERKNALSNAMRIDIEEALAQLRADDQVRALVLTGAGGDFCSGGDLSSFGDGDKRADGMGRERMRALHRAFSALADFDRPVIAAVDGVAYGAGFSLALAADLVIASDRARFCLSFSRVGLVPDLGALYTLPRIVGMQRTRELAYSAREVRADEARELGIVLEVHKQEDLLPRAVQLAAAVAAASPVAFSMTKQLLKSSFDLERDTFLEAEANAQAVAFTTEYLKEAAGRFMRREPARFQWPARDADR